MRRLLAVVGLGGLVGSAFGVVGGVLGGAVTDAQAVPYPPTPSSTEPVAPIDECVFEFAASALPDENGEATATVIAMMCQESGILAERKVMFVDRDTAALLVEVLELIENGEDDDEFVVQ